MNRHGFTLLEILLAIALATLLLTSIYGVFSVANTAKERVEKQAGGLHLMRVLTSRLNHELLGLALNAQVTEVVLSGGTNNRGEPFLKMLTSSGGGPRPGTRRVGYRLGVDQDERMTLWRTETVVGSTVDNAEERLVQGIEQITFSFYDGTTWVNQWNSLEDGRPILIGAEIALTETAGRPPLQIIFELPQRVFNETR